MKYKNTSKRTQTLIGFGVIEPEGIIETSSKINNSNFKLVEESDVKVSVESPKRKSKNIWQT